MKNILYLNIGTKVGVEAGWVKASAILDTLGLMCQLGFRGMM